MDVRAVLDTDVVARGLLQPAGAACDVIDAWIAGRFTQVTCVCLADELRHVLNHPPIAGRLRLTSGLIDRILGALLTESQVLPGRVQLHVLERFPRDDCLLSCAVEGEVQYLVTTSIDLLQLGEYGGVSIVTPEAFLTALPELD